MKIDKTKFNNIWIGKFRHEEYQKDRNLYVKNKPFQNISFYNDNYYSTEHNGIKYRLVCVDIDLKRRDPDAIEAIKQIDSLVITKFISNFFQSKSKKGYHIYFFCAESELYLFDIFKKVNKEPGKNDPSNGIDFFTSYESKVGYINADHYIQKLVEMDIPTFEPKHLESIKKICNILNIEFGFQNKDIKITSEQITIEKIKDWDRILKNGEYINYEDRIVLMRYCGAMRKPEVAEKYIKSIYDGRDWKSEWRQYKNLTEYNEYNQAFEKTIQKALTVVQQNESGQVLVAKENWNKTIKEVYEQELKQRLIRDDENKALAIMNGNQLKMITEDFLRDELTRRWKQKYFHDSEGKEFPGHFTALLKEEIPMIQNDNFIKDEYYRYIAFKNCVYDLRDQCWKIGQIYQSHIYFDYEIDHNAYTELQGIFKFFYNNLYRVFHQQYRCDDIIIKTFFANAIDCYNQTQRCAFYLLGEEPGIGKTRAIELISLGLDKYFHSDIHDLEGQFVSGEIYHKLLIFMDDKNPELRNDFTTRITKTKMSVNNKYEKQVTVKNTNSWYFADNKIRLKGITEKEGIKRRFCIWKLSHWFKIVTEEENEEIIKKRKKTKLSDEENYKFLFYNGLKEISLDEKINILMGLIWCHQHLDNLNYQANIEKNVTNHISEQIRNDDTIIHFLLNNNWLEIPYMSSYNGSQTSPAFYDAKTDTFFFKSYDVLYSYYEEFDNKSRLSKPWLVKRMKEIFHTQNFERTQISKTNYYIIQNFRKQLLLI